MTGPEVGPDAAIKVLANADMGHAEPDGSYEFEYDRNQRLVGQDLTIPDWPTMTHLVDSSLHNVRGV